MNDAENLPSDFEKKVKFFAVFCGVCFAIVAVLVGAISFMIGGEQRGFKKQVAPLFQGFNALTDEAISFSYEMNTPAEIQIKYKGGQPLPLKGMAVDEMVLDKYNRSMTTINKITQEELNKKRDGFYKEAKEFLFDYAGMMGKKKQTLLENATKKQS